MTILALPKLRPGSATMRWVPTIAVVVAPVAWIIGIAGNGFASFIGGLGPALCVVIICGLFLIQPRPLNAQLGLPLDEREAGLRALAYVKGLAIASMPGVFICFYMRMALEQGWWMPSRPDDWGQLMMVLVSWIFGIPLAFANWLVGTPLDDEGTSD